MTLDSAYVYVPWDDGDGWRSPVEVGVRKPNGEWLRHLTLGEFEQSPANAEREVREWLAKVKPMAAAFVARHQQVRVQEALTVALRQCYEYLDGIPESAAGGDDEGVRLARNAKAVLDGIAAVRP